jgi:hypothetical protein
MTPELARIFVFFHSSRKTSARCVPAAVPKFGSDRSKSRRSQRMLQATLMTHHVISGRSHAATHNIARTNPYGRSKRY